MNLVTAQLLGFSGNIRGTFTWTLNLNNGAASYKHESLHEPVESLVTSQGTFREHSANNPGTFEELSGNIWGTLTWAMNLATAQLARSMNSSTSLLESLVMYWKESQGLPDPSRAKSTFVLSNRSAPVENL